MDIDQVRTFLKVIELRNFHKVADDLSITQSTVSTRIKNLETEVGAVLFIRNKAGVTLTEAAEKFERHAQSMIHLWDSAKEEIKKDKHLSESISVGARYGFWEPLLFEWLLKTKDDLPDTHVDACVGTPSTLIQQMHNGTIDICFMYVPYSYTGIKTKQIFIEKFVLVSGASADEEFPCENYVAMDWGKEFEQKHSEAFPNMKTPRVSASLGVLAQSFLKKSGSMGYLPLRLAKDDIDKGDLFLVNGAPEIELPVHMMYSDLIDAETLEIITNRIEEICSRIPATLIKKERS